jgi:hypothetical protein
VHLQVKFLLQVSQYMSTVRQTQGVRATFTEFALCWVQERNRSPMVHGRMEGL